jgi:hypothetical protein
MACFDQRIDNQPRWAFDRNGDFAGRRQVTELSVQFGQAGGQPVAIEDFHKNIGNQYRRRVIRRTDPVTGDVRTDTLRFDTSVAEEATIRWAAASRSPSASASTASRR